MFKIAMAAKVAKEAKSGNRSAMDTIDAIGIIFCIIIGIVVLSVFVFLPIIFSIGGFKMISDGFSDSVNSFIGTGAIGVIFSLSICSFIIGLVAPHMIVEEPPYYLKKDNPQEYADAIKKNKKASVIGMLICIAFIFLVGLAAYFAIAASMVNNFVVAGIIFAVLGIISVIESIICILTPMLVC